jgi:hypothetical protein
MVHFRTTMMIFQSAPLCRGDERGEIGFSLHERMPRVGTHHLVCVSTTESFTGSKAAISQLTGLFSVPNKIYNFSFFSN